MKRNRTMNLSGNQLGMSVTELMVAICIVGILAAVAIPFYISYVQQARVVSIIMPRLHMIQANISLFYSLRNKLPGNDDAIDILSNINTENCDVSLNNGSIVLQIVAPDRNSTLNILDGKLLISSPVITRYKIVSWHLSGELADRLMISY